jgi:hypothetical protein
MAVASGLVEDGQQSIVETHRSPTVEDAPSMGCMRLLSRR